MRNIVVKAYRFIVKATIKVELYEITVFERQKQLHSSAARPVVQSLLGRNRTRCGLEVLVCMQIFLFLNRSLQIDILYCNKKI